jgi:leader peptidase (prepilin peptidase)/N-methyltransferase
MEPMVELGVAAFFVLSYILWPYSLNNGLEIARFILWLVAGIGLAIMFIYDIKWSLLPDVANFAVIAVGVCSATLAIVASTNYTDTLVQIVVSALILSGLYWVLHRISHGRWIGFGDVKLGLGMALLLADWELAFVALFAANLIGCMIVLPGMVTGKLKRNSHVPFGPLLIVGLVVAQLFGKYLVNIYVSSLI